MFFYLLILIVCTRNYENNDSSQLIQSLKQTKLNKNKVILYFFTIRLCLDGRREIRGKEMKEREDK